MLTDDLSNMNNEVAFDSSWPKVSYVYLYFNNHDNCYISPSWSTKAQIDVQFSPWSYELHFFPLDHIIFCYTEIIGFLEISI